MSMFCRKPLPLSHRFLPTLLCCALVAFPVLAQEGKGPKTIEAGKRPRSIDEGKATVTGRQTVIKKVYVAAPLPRRAAYNWVIVRPATDAAEVKIDGKPVAKSADDDFRAELRVGRKYTVSVTAGADYEPFTHSFTMGAQQPEIIDPELKYKFGSVKIVTTEEALEGAKVLVDGKPQKVQLDKANSLLTLDRVPPGKHLITFDHPDYVLYERNAEIAADTEYIWSFVPARPLVELEIETLPKTKVYVDDELKDETADGKLKLSDIRIGTHRVKLVKSGYQEYDATHDFVFQKPVRISHRMKPRQPSTDFQTNFKDTDAALWELPSGAKIVADRLTVLGPTTALAHPRNISYWDFDLQFHLRLDGDSGAAWALRADGENHYYLFHLSGPQGRSRQATFSTYVVRDGKVSAPAVSPVDTGVAAERGYEYTVRVEARGNVINHTVIPAAKNQNDKDVWGREVNLGSFTDEGSQFLFGGFGFRALDTQAFSVSELYVRRR